MINIADQIWAVKAVGRDNLAYMCAYNVKRDGTPDSATIKMQGTGRGWASVGAQALYATKDGGTTDNYYSPNTQKDDQNRPIRAGERPAQQGEEAVYANIPMKGFKVGQDATRWTTDNKVFRLHDPRGFTVEIPTGNLSTLIQTCTIINGEIMDECVWGRDGCHILLPINAPEYTRVVKEIEKVEEALKLKDLKPGDWVKLHQQGEEQDERQFLGMVKLEWTQHRMLFDRVADRRNPGYSYYQNYKEVNFRDDGKQVVRDTQWVGLFATKVRERAVLGKREHAQDQWIYSDPVLALTFENASAKITSRRSGELPEEFKELGIDVLLQRVGSYYRGRTDCPERVTKKLDKQPIKGYYATREAAKDLTEEVLHAKVYQEAKYA